MNRSKNVLALLLTVILFSGCEGLKVLTIYNASNEAAKVTVRPGIEDAVRQQIQQPSNVQTSDSTTVTLMPDSSVTILSIFTGMMFNVKIRERDLRTDYLRIETETETIVASSRAEILKLLKDERTKYRRKSDKDIVVANGRNFGNIFIRE